MPAMRSLSSYRVPTLAAAVALCLPRSLKLQLAASFDQAQDVVDMLGEAMAHCRDKDELIELSTVRCMAIAQLSAAKDVGLTSFQM